MRVENIHSRDIPATAAEVGAVLDSLGSEHDRLWPSRRWPTLRFKRSGPLAVGTPARHGSIRYVVEAYEPGRRLTFRLTPGGGLEGIHGFEITPLGARRTRLTHVIRGRVGTKRLLWWAVVRRYHDAVIEDLLAQADSAASGRPVPDRPWPRWMRVANGVGLRVASLRGLSRRVGRVWA
jgi:hypothetical protein